MFILWRVANYNLVVLLRNLTCQICIVVLLEEYSFILGLLERKGLLMQIILDKQNIVNDDLDKSN